MASSDSKHARDFRRMDDYVFGKLDAPERAAFEQLLSRDADLRKRTESHRQFWDAIRGGDELEAWEGLATEQPEALSSVIDHELFLASVVAKGVLLSGRTTGDGVSKPPSHTSPQPLEPGRTDREPPEMDFGPERS